MKKILLLFAVIVLGFRGNSQLNYGIHTGLSYTDTKFVLYDPTSKTKTTLDANMGPGFILGFMAEAPLAKNLCIRPEFNYLQKNFSFNYISYFGASHSRFRTHYVEMPVNFVYRLPVGTGNMYFGLGPRISMGLSGVIRYDDGSTMDIYFDDESNEIDDDKFHVQRFHVGAGIIAGQQFANGLYGGLEFNLGVKNIAPSDDRDYLDIKTNIIALKIGYTFPGLAESARKSKK